ncbi:lysozyme [Burkholderia sp. Ac-20345]|uniref:lysozyme n=1 Tax=Burkholderia sp. Ac-20345 TaxID=2703891 RepID=UPI00197BB4D3|nr:lysozyme [Burkholderia sp. Ac-20345]MBN3779946.1 lysozyme [Burkholderia sp. Ac-20345]
MPINIKRPGPRSLAATVGIATATLLATYVPKFEGMVLKTYRDPIGVLTYCDGETQGAVLGRTYTPDQCRAMLSARLVQFADGVDGCIDAPLTDYQRAAAISLAYNIGVARFCGSSVAHHFNAREYAQGCAAISLYNQAGGHVVPGLVNRRRIERQICEGKIR